MRHAILAVLLLIGCAAPDDLGRANDEGDERTVAPFDLLLTPTSRLEGLGFEEMAYDGPFIDEKGREAITVRTSRAHARFIANNWGFEFEGLRRRTSVSGETLPPSVALATCQDTTSLLRDYVDIVLELAYMASGSTEITFHTIGTTATGSNEIYAIQFGPTIPTTNPPTIFLFGTHHAREWMGTGVTLGISRWLYDVVRNNADPGMKALLAHTAVVVVPVANPDGYVETRTGDRFWRGNRAPGCSRGVDLNRNMSATWDEDAERTSETCTGDDQWQGNALAAENVALERLLDGDFGHEIAALVSYHAWGDMLIYPAGYKKTTNGDGERCGLTVDEQCFNPDFTLYRDVFGDTHSGLWVDRESDPSVAYPFFRDHSPAILYGVSGDSGTAVNYSPDFPALSVSPELQGGMWMFRIDCEPDPDALILSAVEGQKDVLRRLASAAPGLVTTNLSDAWGPNHIGAFASGLFTREYYGSLGKQEDARPTFVKSLWRPTDPGHAAAVFDNVVHQYRHGRPGAEYNLYYLSCKQGDFACKELPCEIISDAGMTSTDSAPECKDGEVVKLCDPSRLSASGFKLVETEDDCWWEGAQDGDILEYPVQVPRHADTTHCHFTFSAEWDGLVGSIVVERDGEQIFAANPRSPYFWSQSAPTQRRLNSYAFETNAKLPTETQKFVIRIDGTAQYVHVYDPVVYCRSGGLP